VYAGYKILSTGVYRLKKCILRWRLEAGVSGMHRMSDGREFQAVGPATANGHSPNIVMVGRIVYVRVSADKSSPCWRDDAVVQSGRGHWCSLDSTGWWRNASAAAHSLYSMLRWTGSQCSSNSAGRIWSCGCSPSTSLSAAFWTRCIWLSKHFGKLARILVHWWRQIRDIKFKNVYTDNMSVQTRAHWPAYDQSGISCNGPYSVPCLASPCLHFKNNRNNNTIIDIKLIKYLSAKGISFRHYCCRNLTHSLHEDEDSAMLNNINKFS